MTDQDRTNQDLKKKQKSNKYRKSEQMRVEGCFILRALRIIA